MDQSEGLEKIELPQECSIPIEDQILNQNKFEKEVDELCERAEKFVLLNKEDKFEEGIKLYKTSLDIVKKNPWGIKEFQVYDLIKEAFQKKSEFYHKKQQQKEIREIQKRELEKEKELIHAQELKNKQKESEKEKSLRIVKENKKREENYSSQAFDLLEKGSNLMKTNKYDEAIGSFNEAKRLLLEINWPITKVEESLQDLEEKRSNFLAKSDKQSVIPQQENIDYAYDLLGKGSKSLKQKDFDIAIKFYEEALAIFRKIGGKTEINRVTESIQEIKNQKKTYLAELKKAKVTRDEFEKSESIQENHQTAKIKTKKIEKVRKRDDSAKKFDEISNTAYDLLGIGSKLLKQKNFDGAIQSYEKASLLFSEIGNSDMEIKRINESLAQINKEKEIFFAKMEANKKEKDRLKKNKNINQEHLRKKAETDRKKKDEIAEKLKNENEKEKYIIQRIDLAYDLIGKGTDFLKNSHFDSALELYNQAKLIFEETNSLTELKSVKDSILNIEGQKNKYLKKNQREEQARKRLELDKKEEEDLIRKTKEEKERKTSKKAEKIRKESERKKLAEEKIKTAYSLIEQGSALVKKNDFDSALELYNKAKILFKETNSLTELKSVKDSILNIQGQKKKYLKKNQMEEQSRKRLELDKKEEEDLIRKTKEEKERKTSKKAEKIRKESERKKLAEEKIKTAYSLIEQGSALVKKKDFDSALELYNEAKIFFKEAKSTSELKNVEESIISIREDKQKYYNKLEFEERERLRAGEEKKEQEKMIWKLNEAKSLQKAKEERLLQKQIDMAKSAKEKTALALEFIKKGSELVNRNDYDPAVELYEKARSIFKEIKAPTEVKKVEESIAIIRKDKQKYFDKLEFEERERLRIKEERKQQEEMIRKIKEEKDLQKAEEERILQKQIEMAKSANQKTALALEFIKKGSELVNRNDYDPAVELYEKARSIFKEIKAPTEVKKVEESIAIIRKDKQKYFDKLEFEERERLRIEEEKKQQEEMIRKLRAEKSLQKAKEERLLQKQIVMAKNSNQKTALALEFIKKGSELVNRNDYDPAIELYEKARSIFKEIKAPTEVKKVEESIDSIRKYKQKYFDKLEFEERERLRIKEERKQQEEMIKKLREEKSLEKAEEERILQKQIGMAKSANQKTSLALEFIKKGSELVSRNDYDSAIELYEKARSIFMEIKAPTEVKKVKESIDSIRKDKQNYFDKLEQEERERSRIEEERRQQEEMIKKLREEKSLQKAEEERKLQKQIEMAKSVNQKTALALEFIKKGSELVNRNEYDSAIELYEKAKSIFKEIKSTTEVKKVEESIISIREDKQKYLNKLEFEERERLRIEEENKQQEEMIRKIREEKDLQKAEEEQLLQKQIEMAKSTNQKTVLALEFIKKGSELVNRNDYDPAIELYEKARSIFMEIKAPTELKKVEESIISIQEDKQKYHNLLEFEERENSRIKEEKKQQEEMIRKIREEKALQKAEEERILQKQIEMAKSANQKTTLALEFIKKGSELVNRNDYDPAIELYEKARAIFKEIKAPTEVKKVEESIANIQEEKEKYYIKLEHEERERLRIEEEKKQQEEMIKKLREEKSLEKAEEERKLRKQIEMAKSANQKTTLAIEFIKKGSDLVNRNDYDPAIELYEKARSIFKEIKAPTEVKKVEESIANIQEEKEKYYIKLEHEERERLRIEEEKKQQEEMIKKLREEKSLEKAEEERILQKQIEMAKSANQKTALALEFIKKGSDLVNRSDYDPAIELYEKARSIFKEIKAPTEVKKVEESIISIRENKQKYYNQLEFEERERSRIEEENKQQEELIRKIREEKALQRAEEEQILQKQIEMAKSANQKTFLALEFIKKGSELVFQNEYDSAIEIYQKARAIFKEIKAPTEVKKVEESIASILDDKQKYFNKLEFEERERLGIEEGKKQQEEMIRKLREEKALQKAEEEQLLQKQIEKAKSVDQKTSLALEFIKKGSDLVNRNEHDSAIELYEKARAIFKEIKAPTEVKKVEESIVSIREDKQNYHDKLELEEGERLRIEEEKKQQEELIRKFREEKDKQKVKEEENLRKERENAKKYKDKSKIAYNLIEEGSNLVKNHEYKKAIEIYQKSLSIFEKIGFKTEVRRIKDSIVSIKIEKEKFLVKLETEKIENTKIQEAQQKEIELLKIFKHDEENRKAEQSKRLRIELEKAKTKEEKTKAAYSFIERGTDLTRLNDFDSAITDYESALQIFEEIVSVIEAAKVKDSLKSLHKEKIAYLAKLQKEKLEKEKFKEAKRKEEDLIKKLQEEAEKRKAAERRRLQAELEAAQTTESKRKTAFNYIEYGTDLVKTHDFDEAIEYYKKALIIYEKVDSISEAIKVRESLGAIQAEKNNYLSKLETERVERKRKEQEKYREGELFKKAEEEKRRRAEEDSKRLQREIGKAQKVEEKIDVALDLLDKGSELLEQNEFDGATDYYNKAQKLFIEVGATTEAERVKESLTSISINKDKFLLQIKQGELEKERKEEAERKERELIERLRLEEEKRKNAESEKLRIEMNTVKTKEEKFKAAYRLIEQGTALINQNNDYDTAINYYEKALVIFEEINSSIEISRIKESLLRLHADKKAYILKIERERQYKKKMEETKNREDELLRRLKEEEIKRKTAELEKLNIELEVAKTKEEKSKAGYNYIEQGSLLINQNDYDTAIEYYEKALSIFTEIEAVVEITKVKASLLSIQAQKIGYLARLEREKIQAARLEESERRERDLIEKLKSEENKRKIAENIRLKLELEAAKTKDEKITAAYGYIEQGSVLVDNNDYDTAINYYEKALSIFDEIGSISESAKIKESLVSLTIEKKSYLSKLEKARIERKKLEEDKIQEEDLLRKIKEEEKRRKVAEKEKLRLELENAKTIQEKTQSGYNYLEKGSELAGQHDYDVAIEHYKEALLIFKEIDSKTEVLKINESISNLIVEKKNYIEKLKKESLEKERREEEKVKERELLKQIEEERMRKAKEVSEKMKKEVKAARSREEKTNLAYQFLERGSELIKQEKEFDSAIELYIKAKSLFEEIKSKTEALRVEDSVKSLKIQKEKHYLKLEKERIEKENLEEMKRKEEDLIRIKQEEDLKRKEEEEQKYLKQVEEAHSRREKANIAYELLEKGSELVDLYEYDKGLESYEKAFKLLKEIGSSTECNKVKESIKVIESEKKQYMLKLEQEKANKKKREEIQINLEKLIRQRIEEENERKREEELRLRQEIEEAKGKESKTKIAYKLIQQGTVLAENDDYDSGIELYIKAQRIFEQIGSKTEIQKVEEGLGDIRGKKRKYLVKIQNIKFEGERFEQIQLETKRLISKIDAEKNSLKQAETEKLRDRLESVKNNEELGKFAYDCIENSNNFIEEKEFEKALEELKKGMELFNLIGWKIEANRTEEEIDKTKERWESYLKNLEKTKILEEQKRRESEEFKKRINEEKKQLEAEYKIREMEKRKETAEKLHIVKIQNEAAEILKKGSELTRNGDFKQAEIQFNEALKLFESVNWKMGIDMTNDALLINQREMEKSNRIKVTQLKSLEEVEKELLTIEERIKKSKDDEEKKRILKEKESLDKQKTEQRKNQIEGKIINILAEGSGLISKFKYKEGISKYEQTIPLFREISWEQKRDQVLDMIESAKKDHTNYLQKIETEKILIEKEKAEQEELRRRIDEFERTKEIRIQEAEKSRIEALKREKKITELKDQAWFELAKANASINRKKYQKALSELEIALSNFNELGWEKEKSSVEVKILDLKTKMKEAYKPKRKVKINERDLASKAYALIDKADIKIRRKKYEEALPQLHEAHDIFNKIKWNKAKIMVEQRIDQVESMTSEKKSRMNRLKKRKQQKTVVEAYNLLDMVDKNRKERRFKIALDNAKNAQKIFRDIDWIKEADDMEKMISQIEKDLTDQEKAVKESDRERLQKIKAEEKETEKLKKIIEDRRKKRRAARKKL